MGAVAALVAVFLGNMASQKNFTIKHRATLVAKVAVFHVHVRSQVLLAVRHIPALATPECMLLHLVLLTLQLGCKCFGTFVTFSPTLVSFKLRIGLVVFMAFLALKNWGGWSRLHRSWAFHYRRRRGGRKAFSFHGIRERARSAAGH